MDLSCVTNRLNDQHATYLMPGQELHETPAGDVSQDVKAHRLRTRRVLGLQLRAAQ